MARNRIKKTNRGEAIRDCLNKLADHADAIGEVRKAIENEVKGRDETDAEFSRQFEEYLKSATAEKKVDRIRFVILFDALKHYQAFIEYRRLPWWRRLRLRLKGEVPWSKPVQSFIKRDRRASEGPIGEQSSTSSPTDAAADSCTKSSTTKETTPRSSMDGSSEAKPSSPSSPTSPPSTSASDSGDPASSRAESPPTGGRETPTDS